MAAFVLLAVGSWMISNNQIDSANKTIEATKEQQRKESRAESKFMIEQEKIRSEAQFKKAMGE